MEAVQVLHPDRSGEVDEAGVDVLGVLVPVDQEGAHAEVGALDPDRRPARGQRQLVYGVEVHVQDPELLLLLANSRVLCVMLTDKYAATTAACKL